MAWDTTREPLPFACTVDAGLAVGGVEEDVEERLLGQVAVGEGGNLLVEVGADPGDLGLGDPGVRTERLDQVVDLPHAGAGWRTR